MDNQKSILEQIQHLKKEIFNGKARNLSLGEHKSKHGGFGFEIRDVEQWERNDSFSSINWQLSLASYPKKIYKLDRVETKETPVIVIADCSPSMLLGFDSSDDKFKLLLHLLGTFSFTASYFHDSVAMAVSGISEEAFVPLRHGHGHVMMMIYRLLQRADEFHKIILSGGVSSNEGMNLNDTIELAAHRIRRRSTVVIISDFIDAITGKAPLDMEMIEYLSAKHNQNIVALFVQDDNEFAWSRNSGTVLARNIETGRTDEVKASHFKSLWQTFGDKREVLQKSLADVGVESVVLSWTDYFPRLADFMMSRRLS